MKFSIPKFAKVCTRISQDRPNASEEMTWLCRKEQIIKAVLEKKNF